MKKQFERVYFIDDDPIFTFISKILISEENFCEEIQVFENGKEAIDEIIKTDILNEKLPNIIFLDITMPIMNGWEFLETFNTKEIKNKETTKIIVMSSSINPKEISMIRSHPIVFGHIIKPLTPADLNKILSTLD